jgi:tetratricopeptide (TPR) repeat protein
MFMRQSDADSLVQAAVGALNNGHVTRAGELLDKALLADPHHLMALAKQAEVALYRKDPERALALTRTALDMEPNFAPAWHQHAWACWMAGRPADGLLAARRAVEIQPPNPDFRLRLAQFAAWTGHGAECEAALAPLLAAERHDPLNHAAAFGALGELAIAEGRFGDALPFLDRALRLYPGLQTSRMMRGMNQLRLGRLADGWPDYAVREDLLALYPDDPSTLADRTWQGEDLSGRTLVVTDDQGHGDAIQFFRYVPMLRDRGAAHITWRTFPQLVRLFGETAPYVSVVAALRDDARFDFQCNSTSLPRWFGTEIDSIPAREAYLWPPSRSRQTLTRPAGRRRKVGLVWSGDVRHTRDHLRSIPAALFLSLADISGISFHSLQHAVRATDLPALESRPAVGRAVEQAMDFAETAGLIAHLDLVITVDTAIAHLAGAMGKPVWIVLHVAPDWRWLTDRDDSPWYADVRLFRVTPAEWQAAKGEAGWPPVLDRVAAALRDLAAR